MTSPVVVAIDVGGTAVKVAVVDKNRQVLLHRSHRIEHLRGRPEMVGEIVRICVAGMSWCREQLGVEPVAVGVVIPGIVDASTGTGISSMLLGWQDVPFGDLIQSACGVPTAVGHDVRTAAIAEFSRSPGITDALFVTVGTGIGAATLIGGDIRTGGHGYGGEIAHLVVDPDGPPCPCGKCGCVEVIASGPAVARAYHSASGAEGDAREVATATSQGDPIAAAVWRRSADMLGKAIAMYAQIMDPTTVIVGGGLSEAGELLLAPIRRALRSGMSLPCQPEVRTARLGSQAGVHGAALIAQTVIQGSL